MLTKPRYHMIQIALYYQQTFLEAVTILSIHNHNNTL